MQKLRHCYSYPQASKRLTPNISKDKDQQRRMQTLKKISPPTPPVLTCLVGNSHLLFSRFLLPTQKMTKTTTEALSVEKDKAKTHLWWVSTSLWRKKKETFLKSIAFIIEKKAIMPTSVFRRRNKSQKTSIGLSSLHIDNWW